MQTLRKAIITIFIFVLPCSQLVAATFETINGEVVIEAENYSDTSGAICSWNEFDGYMQSSTEDPGTLTFNEDACRLDYQILFHEPGRYYVHLRTHAIDHTENGFFATLDGNEINYGGIHPQSNLPTYYIYVRNTNSWLWYTDGGGAHGRGLIVSMQVNTPGYHTFSLHRRDKGSKVDRIWLTREQNQIQNTPTLTLPDADAFIIGNGPGPNPGVKKYSPVDDAYLQGATRYNNEQLRLDHRNNRVSYLKFDVSDLALGSINSAVLRLRVRKDAGSGPMSIFLGDNNQWTESNLNPSNAPATAGSPIAGKNENYNVDQWYEFDVTEAVTANGPVTFILRKDTAQNDVAFGSKECAGYEPELIVSSGGTQDRDIRLTLVNANTDSDIDRVDFNRTVTVINLNEVGNSINIRADVLAQLQADYVEFFLDDHLLQTERTPPYALAGDTGGDYHDWQVSAGEYTLSTIAYDAQNQEVARRTDRLSVMEANNNILISLHYDHKRDPDDGHATVAARTITGQLGINPHVVSGAYGKYSAEPYRGAPVEAVMDETWGVNGWQDAHNDNAGAIEATANRWHNTIENGGHVWIAEGGPSDFTHDVLRILHDRFEYTTGTTMERVHVVQHGKNPCRPGGGFLGNEKDSDQAKLQYVKNNTDYITLGNGNCLGLNGSNGTADLQFSWIENRSDIQTFMRVARAHPEYGDAWTAALAYYNPNPNESQTADLVRVYPWRFLDFSDTVELLYILNIGLDEVTDCNDFRRRFLE